MHRLWVQRVSPHIVSSLSTASRVHAVVSLDFQCLKAHIFGGVILEILCKSESNAYRLMDPTASSEFVSRCPDRFAPVCGVLFYERQCPSTFISVLCCALCCALSCVGVVLCVAWCAVWCVAWRVLCVVCCVLLCPVCCVLCLLVSVVCCVLCVV